jgi:hypothetical protein
MQYSVREEQGRLFGWRGKKQASTSTSFWSHKFFCLSDTGQSRIPTTASAKVLLEEAGLGEKKIDVPCESNPEAFHALILSCYPKLKNAGGFELLRCLSNTRDLEVLSPRISCNPMRLKRAVGNGRVYVRPIQRDLSLAETEEEEELAMVCTVTSSGISSL